MTPESQNYGARGDVIARQRLCKHIPTATNMQATIEELQFLCNGEVNTPL
jgi:hypothetical protein